MLKKTKYAIFGRISKTIYSMKGRTDTVDLYRNNRFVLGLLGILSPLSGVFGSMPPSLSAVLPSPPRLPLSLSLLPFLPLASTFQQEQIHLRSTAAHSTWKNLIGQYLKIVLMYCSQMTSNIDQSEFYSCCMVLHPCKVTRWCICSYCIKQWVSVAFCMMLKHKFSFCQGLSNKTLNQCATVGFTAVITAVITAVTVSAEMFRHLIPFGRKESFKMTHI